MNQTGSGKYEHSEWMYAGVRELGRMKKEPHSTDQREEHNQDEGDDDEMGQEGPTTYQVSHRVGGIDDGNLAAGGKSVQCGKYEASYIDQYDIKDYLGSGSYGTVYHAVHKDSGKSVAIKEQVLHSTETLEKELLKREFEFLKKVEHRNIVQVYGRFLSKDKSQIVMELLPRGSVLDVIKTNRFRLHESTIRRYAKDVLEGLAYMHREPRRFVHRDIKPGNLLVDEEDRIKIADLGCTERGSVDTTQISGSVVGTLPYLSPEAREDGLFGPASDIWALGCTIVEMALGHVHWLQTYHPSPSSSRDNGSQQQRPITSVQLMMTLYKQGTPPIPKHLSPALQSLLQDRMFATTPEDRGYCKDYLEDPYFRGGGEEGVIADKNMETMEQYEALKRERIEPEATRKLSSSTGGDGSAEHGLTMRSFAATATIGGNTGLLNFTE